MILCLGPGETDPSSPLQAAGQAMGLTRLLIWYIRAWGRESGRNRTRWPGSGCRRHLGSFSYCIFLLWPPVLEDLQEPTLLTSPVQLPKASFLSSHFLPLTGQSWGPYLPCSPLSLLEQNDTLAPDSHSWMLKGGKYVAVRRPH